jgi:glycosyltransferase involved in cell wall biosynthesis
MQEFRFLIQTGSNYGNDTPRIERARAVLRDLKAKFPGRIRSFDSVETPEQFYFLMKHVRGVIAPYKLSAYAKRGSGVILEALQMGLEVFSWAKTDIYATFKNTGQVVGVNEGASFAQTIIDHYAKGARRERRDLDPPIAQVPKDVCRRLLSLCNQHMLSCAEGPRDAVLWVGNDTFGEGCSNVYFSQKQALHELRRDCIELFVPWPDPNWAGVASHAYDEKIYGFGPSCEATGIAWVAQPKFSNEMQESLRQIANSGPTYELLRNLSFEFKLADTFKKTVVNNRISHAILNYAHLYPVIEELVAPGNVICEAHDIIAYQHAIRRRDSVSLTEKIDEFTDLAQFTNIISISAQEQREIAGACGRSAVFWKLPPYIPESPPRPSESPDIADVKELSALGGVPDSVALPSPTMLRTYYARPDLQVIFPLDSAEGRSAYFRWWVLCGQAEIANGFGLTKDQFGWLTGKSDKRKGEKLSGVFKLMLSVRDDLRRSFWNGRKNVEGLQRWGREHAVQEFDASISQLIQSDRNGAAKAFVPNGNPEACGTLRAVLDSNPIREPDFEHTLQELYDRLADVENIDLALVGSGHLSNVTSFRWFINEVHLKYLAVKNRNLFVIGSACDALADINHPSIFLMGRCSRVGPILTASLACPLPVVLGSGSPIKVIPALALNGAVTVTDHIERAFKLGEYGIPAFDEPRKFADDIWALLSDKEQRVERQRRAARYVEDHLSFGGYVRFWQSLLDPLFT